MWRPAFSPRWAIPKRRSIFLAASSTLEHRGGYPVRHGVRHGRCDGVAWATFLCQGVSCVLALGVRFPPSAKSLLTGGQRAPCLLLATSFGRVAVIAIPSILQQSFISVGNIVIQSVINSFGAAVMAGYLCVGQAE